MQKIKWLDRQVGAPGPYLTLCTSEVEYLAVMRKLKVTGHDDWIKTPQADATVHFLEKSGNFTVVVCVRVNPYQPAISIAGLLVHESVHIWQNWCEFYGERKPGDEQEAYFIQSISQTLMTEYARRITDAED